MTKEALEPIFEKPEESVRAADLRPEDLTDGELAKIVKRDRSTVNRWRRGKSKPPSNLEWEAKGDRWCKKQH